MWVRVPLRAPSDQPAGFAARDGHAGVARLDDHAWDLWNEPDNQNADSIRRGDPPDKDALVAHLLPEVYAWARSQHPDQPLTSGIWRGDGTLPLSDSAVVKVQLAQSDILSFHNYSWPENFEARVKLLEAYHRPLICTEYMARALGSTFDTILPVARRHKVGVINWGLVAGKTQTYYPWDSVQHPFPDGYPTTWFHDVFYPDGRPYRPREIELLRGMNQGQ